MKVIHVKSQGTYTVISQNVKFTRDHKLATPQGTDTPHSFSGYLEADPEWLFTFQNASPDENGLAAFIGWADDAAPVQWDQDYVAYLSHKDGTIWLRPVREFWEIVRAKPHEKLLGVPDHYRFDVVPANARPPIYPFG